MVHAMVTRFLESLSSPCSSLLYGPRWILVPHQREPTPRQRAGMRWLAE